MAYTPPAGDAVNYNFTSGTYTPPDGATVIFNFTTNNLVVRRRQIFQS